MPASSRAPRFLLCLFPILSVLASARNFPVPNIPRETILKITITEQLNPSSPIPADDGGNVLVIVNNRGRDSVSIYENVVQEIGSQYSAIKPLLTLMQAGPTDATHIPADNSYHTVPASHTSSYHFEATQGSYRCVEIKENKGMTVLIVRDQEPKGIGGLDEAAPRPNEDQDGVPLDNRKHDSTVDVTHHPGMLNGLAVPRGNDLVTAKNEGIGGLDEAALRPSEDQDVVPLDNRQHDSTVDVIHHPGMLNGLAVPRGNDLVTAKNEAPEIEDLFVLTDDLTDNHNAQYFGPSSDILITDACEHPATLAKCQVINWASEEHRRPCLARIVNTVYCGNNNVTALELSLKDTGFSLEEPIKDGGDMYAAIYKYERRGHNDAPDIIVAFRGTQLCLKWKAAKDMWLNCQIGVNAVEYADRFKQAYEKVKQLRNRGYRVWLTGHSQGASLALHVGRQAMLKQKINLQTFAFNPALAIVCWFPRSLKKFIATMRPSSPEQSVILSKWTPELYVHDKDFIFCRCFIKCLKNPTQLDKCVTKLPSVMLCQVSGNVQGGGPHSLMQWFKPNSQLNLNCQPVKSTDGGDNLISQDVKCNDEYCEDDIEAQNNQNLEAPSQDQHAPPTGPSTARKIAIVGALLATTIAAIIIRRIPNSSHGRTNEQPIPTTTDTSEQGWRATPAGAVTWLRRRHQRTTHQGM